MKLSKAQEQRFDEKFPQFEWTRIIVAGTRGGELERALLPDDKKNVNADPDDLKQHLASELQLQKKELLERIEDALRLLNYYRCGEHIKLKKKLTRMLERNNGKIT